ncbi:MAG: hypothetical protein F6K16_16400 [Symploca sp. SIO2B6]|nr:hypothetical protein [Symploca sp. SIO2B6]
MPYNNSQQDSTPATHASSYRERLYPWAIVSILPDMQRTTVSRFRSRSDAEGHLQCLRQLKPNDSFIMVFAPKSDMNHKSDIEEQPDIELTTASAT